MIQLHIVVAGQPKLTHDLDRPLELGRQQANEPAPFAHVEGGDAQRLIIAAREDVSIGRRQLRVEPASPGHVQLTNLNQTIAIALQMGTALAPGESRRLALPVVLGIAALTVRIQDDADESAPQYESLSQPTLLPGSLLRHDRPELPSLVASLRQHDTTAMLSRLERLIGVLQLAASSPQFAHEVAVTACELVDLDHAAVVLRDGHQWIVEAQASRGLLAVASDWHPSRTLLERVARERRTFWRGLDDFPSGGVASLRDVVGAVAAPILDAAGQIRGAIYGDRRSNGRRQGPPLGKVDAQLVEILACGVAGGLTRLEHERASIARRIQFERFVTPEVSRQLDEDPTALEVRDATVTLLFCDIAGFSGISERLSTQQTFAWINDVMETLSACVLEHGGTLVDYVGDELIAMWGAPYSQEHHAAAACRAALAMLQSLGSLSERWLSLLGGPVTVGIGINSGVVGVGNTGSQFKLKYGPLGSHVNIASRVQGATRHLRTNVLLTGATAAAVEDAFPIRRVCAVRVKNIAQPLDLFELQTDPQELVQPINAQYAQALQSWEARDLNGTIRQLSQFIALHPEDGPALVLLSRAVEAWTRSDLDYDPVWQLPSK